MPRYLVCIDPTPATDGSCQTTAWVDVGGIKQYLPTTAQATELGSIFMVSLLTLAAAKRILKPQKGL